MTRHRNHDDTPTEAAGAPAKKTSRRGRGRATAKAAESPVAAAPAAGSTPAELARVPMPVRWRDLDAFNHVNNASFLTYLEEARLVWLQSLPGPWVSEDVAPLLAAVHINYRRPIEWPAELTVELSCERLGNSSLTLGHRIVDAKDGAVIYADGNTVLVWIDRHGGQATALPEAVREACQPQ